ncbi:hypothetical protein ABZ851_16665 [Streptomyces sp. NPDC047049]|uniref:hypothetical protein n=1 Tax=Streptomyces sp. NPDC047049 TaxID=3156688 RepID=UPI0033F52445
MPWAATSANSPPSSPRTPAPSRAPPHLDPALAASAADGRPVARGFVTWLESSVGHLTGMATVDRQHSAQLLDSYDETVVGLLG